MNAPQLKSICPLVRRELGVRTLVAAYSITMGIVVAVFWTVLWATGSIPDIMMKPWEMVMHLTAEFTMAALLFVSGLGLWFGAHWALRMNMFASGMLVYSLIQTPGYYLQRDAMIFVLMFAVAFLMALLLSPAFKSSLESDETPSECGN